MPYLIHRQMQRYKEFVLDVKPIYLVRPNGYKNDISWDSTTRFSHLIGPILTNRTQTDVNINSPLRQSLFVLTSVLGPIYENMSDQMKISGSGVPAYL